MKMDRQAPAPDPTNRPAHLSLSGLSLTLEGHAILHGLDLSLDFKRLGVLGRNGSGKSTLARVIAGLVAPTEGLARLNGADMGKDRRAALKEVGILFQNPDHQIIFPTVLEDMAFGLIQLGQGKRQAEAEARRTLARFGKSHWADVAVSTLSHGQKHLVCLMAVVVMRPSVIVLDEPFAGLDIPTRLQLRRALRMFPGAVIHISHDPQDTTDCETCVWLDQGRIIQLGDGAAVTRAYLAAMSERGAGDDLSDLAG